MATSSANKGLTLRRLVLLGPNKKSAEIEFGPNATVISGPSNTGKTFILRVISYMFGGEHLEPVVEMDGYTRGMLCLDLPDGSTVTLARFLGGGNYDIYEGDNWIEEGSRLLIENLAWKHRTGGKKGNFSKYLLKYLGLDEALILSSESTRATRHMSIRELMRLAVIEEGRMIGDLPPATPRGYVNQLETFEKNLFTYLITGRDSSHLEGQKRDTRPVASAKSGVLDEVVMVLSEKLRGLPERDELERTNNELLQDLQRQMSAVEELISERTSLTNEFRELEVEIGERSEQVAELRQLYSRFELLHLQYQSDLRRLELTSEAGGLLQLFNLELCPICGAPAESQHRHSDIVPFAGDWVAAVQAEISQISLLDLDLSQTLQSLLIDMNQMTVAIDTLSAEQNSREQEIKRVDGLLEPSTQRVRQLTDAHINNERALQTYEQIESVERIRVQDQDKRAEEQSGQKAKVGAVLSLEEVAPIVSGIRRNLLNWGIDDAQIVRFDLPTFDIVVGGKRRANHGKGMKAIIHAAFTVALGDYGLAIERPVPGFVVLDTPVLTYRSAEKYLDDNDLLDVSVAQRFYEDLGSRHRAQIIVIENIDPIGEIDGVKSIRFTKDMEVGRFGFLCCE
jgi:hypothetical protein